MLTPLAPLGVVLAIVGGAMWALAPAAAPATQQMVDEVSAGGWGCGPALTVVFLVCVLFVILAAAIVGGVTVGGGI